MYRIAIITVYYGKLPQYFPMWLESCKHNETIDFFVYTDDRRQYEYPPNVHVSYSSFQELKEQIQKKYQFAISLDRPYKLCDFKVAYGEIFEADLIGYDFWGHCDLDQIMGDLRSFLKEEILQHNDRIYRYGHLTLYRNTKKINCLYRESGSYGWKDYKEVLSSPIDYAFDEVGVRTMLKSGLKIRAYNQMDGTDLAWTRMYCEKIKCEESDVNTKNQVFYWQNGHTYQCCYYSDHQYRLIETAYIHFGHKNPDSSEFKFNKNINAFYITAYKFVPKYQVEVPSVEEILKLNPYPGYVRHLIEVICTEWKWTYWRRIKRKVKLLWQEIRKNV